MWPIVTNRVEWSVWLSVCLSVCHTSERYKNGWTDRDVVWVMDSGEPKEACIRWSPDPACEGALIRGKGMPAHAHARRYSSVSYAKIAEPIDLICRLGCGFGLAEGNRNSIVFCRLCQCSLAGGHIGATWRIRLNCPPAAATRPYVKLQWALVRNAWTKVRKQAGLRKAFLIR